MPRTEMIEKRTAKSKTFDNGDGTFTLESGRHAHHQKDGAWVDTDCYLYGDSTEKTDAVSGEKYTHETKEHPNKIRINKFKQPLRIDDIVIRPIGARQVDGVKSVNKISYSQPWDGIDVDRIVTPEGLVEEITITSSAGQCILEWDVSGEIGSLSHPIASYNGEMTQVPFYLTGSTLSYDLSSILVGSVIR